MGQTISQENVDRQASGWCLSGEKPFSSRILDGRTYRPARHASRPDVSIVRVRLAEMAPDSLPQ
jgi:hypothetical protein